MKPLVSLVVPIYNVEKYIEKCIKSILNQTYKNLEIILVNDGSPDNSGHIAEKYASLDDRIKVIHKKNGGLSDARNAGMSIAKGDYICFIDSDDYIEKNMIEIILKKAIENNSDVVLCGFSNIIVDKEEKILCKIEENFDDRKPESMVGVIGYAWNKLYKLSYLKSNNFIFKKGLSLVEDIVFNEEVILNTENIEYINKPLYNYIVRDRDTLAKQYYKDVYKIMKIGFISRENVIYKLFGENQETKSIMANSYVNGIRYCCSNMFFYKNDLSIKDKYLNIKEIIYDNDTIKKIKLYKPNTKLDSIVKFCIMYKKTQILIMLYYIRSKMLNNRDNHN